MFRHIAVSVATFVAGAALMLDLAAAATFSFGGSQNNLNGQATKSLSSGGFTMQLSGAVPGTLLNESQGGGLGIDSSPNAGSADPTPGLFNIIRGDGSAADAHEALFISFDRPGVLTGINFDGVKDELLEFFTLATPASGPIHFFDSAANTTIAGAVDGAILAGALPGQVVYLLEINNQIDDEAQGLQLPFAAGQQFALTINELGPSFGALGLSNGARLQGITVESVPEPATIMLATGLVFVLWQSNRKDGLGDRKR